MASTRVIHCCFYCIVLLWIQHAPNNSPTVIMTSWRLGGDIHISSFIVLEVSYGDHAVAQQGSTWRLRELT
ncbi:hypothetical protein HBH70_165850 [Parastagonospora nodorum]|nr:hypothetical protein HBH70_165850 [Parastagonospora nodorum]